MIKVTVLYPTTEGSRFDMDYYLASHMAMVADRFGAVCKGWGVDQGIASGPANVPAPYECMTWMLFDTVEEFGAAFDAAAGEIVADVVNFTDIMPSFQVSEVRA